MTARTTMTRMDAHGDRYIRANGKWAKIAKQQSGGYTVVRGWAGEIQMKPFGKTINHNTLDWARSAAEDWITDR